MKRLLPVLSIICLTLAMSCGDIASFPEIADGNFDVSGTYNGVVRRIRVMFNTNDTASIRTTIVLAASGDSLNGLITTNGTKLSDSSIALAHTITARVQKYVGGAAFVSGSIYPSTVPYTQALASNLVSHIGFNITRIDGILNGDVTVDTLRAYYYTLDLMK